MSSQLATANAEWRRDCQQQRSKTLRQRFIEKTQRNDDTGCLMWIGAHDKDGYGFIRIDGKNVKAHRVALGWKVGRLLLRSEQALHKCDQPACVEETHLFVGDNSANQIDCALKRRHRSQRLVVSDVSEIRTSHSNGESQASLSRRFNVSDGHISRIVHGLKWSHVA